VKRATVALAVSGHGFGHAVRCAEVARALIASGARVVMWTDAPPWLFPPEVEWLPSTEWPVDVGVVQRDGLEMDINATRAQWREFARGMDERADVEARLLSEAGVDVVVADIPPLAFVSAARAGIPSFGMTNFTWDWIYAAWPDFEDVVARIRSSYAQAQALLRLPLHTCEPEAFAAWKAVEDVPLIARRATRPRQQVRAEYGLPADARVVLVSFGGFAARDLDLMRFAESREYLFVITPPLTNEINEVPPNVRAVNPAASEYVSLLAACDVVVTKPGYGIVSDCLANRVAVLFTDRGPFREYDVLVEALFRLGRARYVPRADVLSGELGAHLDQLLATRTPWTDEPMNGADVVARRVLDRVTIEENLLSR
jgi:UDP:flavonoid glycosyltransferase YjiC (YdhE family)